jgi:hypothetical protein
MRIILGLLIAILAVGFGATEMACDDDSGSDSDGDSDGDSDSDGDADACGDWCALAYDECADTWVNDYGYTEDDVATMLEDCEAGCEPDEECEGWVECYMAAYEDAGLDECLEECGVDEAEAYNQCLMDSDCADLVDYLNGGENPCQSEYDDYATACDDVTAACTDAIMELSTEEYDALTEAWDACDDEWDCE